MERFRPLISQTNNFVDPLTASLSKDDDTVSVGEDPMSSLLTGSMERPSVRQDDHFSSTNRPPAPRVLGAGLPYCTEWAEICRCAGTELIQNLGRTGEMRACRFRSVCWFIYLKILPASHIQWLKVLRAERERYETVRLELMVTPGQGDETLDPLLNNPLSQDEQSPWNQYFEDSELKKLIRQDVVRTFPEVEFFQSQRIRDMMVTVLFCHARRHPELGYRQGMHEVLAPLIFVLHCDHQAHKHAQEMDTSLNILQEVMDEAYLEHDAFSLFEGVMKGLEPWYIVAENSSHPDPRSNLLNAQPFARPQDIGPTNLLVQKLTSIHDELLQLHDPPLYTHLARLEIPPQIYGIRWIRLLFGREFPLQDLLMVWDAIFSDIQPTFPLVDYLTVAMLSFIREPLLTGDYTTCLKFLMRYPASADVQYIIQLALHLRNPKQYPRPPGYSSSAAQHIPTVGGRPDVHRGPQPHTTSHASPRSSSVPRTTQHQVVSMKAASSAQQPPPETNAARRLSSPSAITDPLNAAVIFSTNHSVNSGGSSKGEGGHVNEGAGGGSYPGRASRVVSGLVRLGGKLGRPKELPVSRHLSIQSPPTPPSNTDKEHLELIKATPTVSFTSVPGQSDKPVGGSTMKELSIVRTQSVPAGGIRPRVEQRVTPQEQSSDDSEDEISDTKPSLDNQSEALNVEDLAAVCLGCAMNLSHHTAALRTRLEQLSIQPDITLRTALDGIAEVIETLSNVRSHHQESCGSSVSNGQMEEGGTTGPSSLVPSVTQDHPLRCSCIRPPSLLSLALHSYNVYIHKCHIMWTECI